MVKRAKNAAGHTYPTLYFERECPSLPTGEQREVCKPIATRPTWDYE